jgi:DNA invertase Pin-like site-specific DNA recombinase
MTKMGPSITSGAPKKAPRVVLYARTSTIRDQNPRMQVDALRQLAEQRGWTIVHEYIDAGHSGSKDRRPQLDALMRHVHRGGVDVVLVWRFDRFARSVRHLVMALEEFRSRGVDFVSMQDSIDTSTPTGRFTFAVIAAVAELEREIIRERTKCGLEAARRRGAKIGRPRVRVDVEEAQRLVDSGLSVRKVAHRMKCGASTLTRALRADPGDAPEPSPDGAADEPSKQGPAETTSAAPKSVDFSADLGTRRGVTEMEVELPASEIVQSAHTGHEGAYQPRNPLVKA